MSAFRNPSPFLISPKTIRSPTSIVHLEYDIKQLEPVPSPDWTRFVCISDTHTRSFEVPDGDVLLHGGDLTIRGTVEEFANTVSWLRQLPHKFKIVIAGNHDITLHDGWYDGNWHRWHAPEKQSAIKIRELLKDDHANAAGIVYLQDQEHTFQIKESGKSWTVYGSPWSPMYCNWAFNYKNDEASVLMSKLPKTDILLTHGPAFGIFDRNNLGDLVGCKFLRKRLPELRPRIHLSGHIHEARGAHIHEWKPDASSNLPVPMVQTDDDDSSKDSVENTSFQYSQTQGETTALNMNLNSGRVERTVFVNAANTPSGRRSWKQTVAGTHHKRKVPSGGIGFQPVVVDLKDDDGSVDQSVTILAD